MEEQRKERRWGLWLMVGLVLLVAYPLSIGPAMGLHRRKLLHPALDPVLRIVYNPVLEIAITMPEPTSKALQRYIKFWMPPKSP